MDNENDARDDESSDHIINALRSMCYFALDTTVTENAISSAP